MVTKLDQLQQLLESFFELIQKLVDENAAIRFIHKELMSIIRDSAMFMSEVPNLLNQLIQMLTVERMNIEDDREDIADIKNKVDDIHKFIEFIKDRMTALVDEKLDDNNTNNNS